MLTFSVNKDINEVVKAGVLTHAKPTTDVGRYWLSELWVKALDERVDDKVNVDAYAFACERNSKMTVGSKEVALLSVEELETGLRGVADTVASYLDVNIDTIINSSEVRTLIADFCEVHEMLLIDEGVNLWKVLKAARKSNARMIDKLRDLISRHSLEDLIASVLGNSECLVYLEEAMV